MANNVTYKTIISNAIKGFNDIQDALHNINANYGTQNPTTVPTATTAAPLSIAQILSSDAFTTAELDITGGSQTAITTTIKSISTNNVVLSGTATSFSFVAGKDSVTSSGSITPALSVTSPGYLASDATISSDPITFTESTITNKTFYIQAGTLKVINGTPTNASATAGIDSTDTTHLAKLREVANTGISYNQMTGTPGVDYWKILPIISSVSSGSVSGAKARPDQEGYVKGSITPDGQGAAVTVDVLPVNGSTLYVSRLRTGSFEIEDKPNTNVNVGSISAGYYPISTSLSGTWSATAGGYLPVTGSVTGTDSSVIVGRMAAATITSAIGATTTRGFTASGTSTAWSVAVTPTVTISNAGYAPQNTVGINGSLSTVYLPGAVLQDGFVTSAGMVSVDNEFYITRYNTNDECVEIVFKDGQSVGDAYDVTQILAENY